MLGGDGEDQAGDEGLAERVEEQVRVPSTLRDSPPMVQCGRERGDQVGIEQWAELGNCVAAPVVAGEGAINPAELPLML